MSSELNVFKILISGYFPAPGHAFRSISEMGAMLTMLTTGIKSGPSSEANGGNGGTVSTVGGGKSGSGVKPSAGISSKKVRN